MKRERTTMIVVFCLLVTLGVVSRLVSDAAKPTLSNFTSLAAGAMFAGYFFRHPLAAFLVPAAAIGISDFCLQRFESIGQLVIVLVAFLIPVLIGMVLRRKLNPLTVVGGALLSSVTFFIITNFAEWAFYDLYPHTASGLVTGYIAALPFFRNTILGDLFFSGVIFGIYYCAVSTGLLYPRQPQLAPVPVTQK